MAHAFNPSTQEAEAELCEFEASLVYKVSSRTGSKARETLFQKKQTKDASIRRRLIPDSTEVGIKQVGKGVVISAYS